MCKLWNQPCLFLLSKRRHAGMEELTLVWMHEDTSLGLNMLLLPCMRFSSKFLWKRLAWLLAKEKKKKKERKKALEDLFGNLLCIVTPANVKVGGVWIFSVEVVHTFRYARRDPKSEVCLSALSWVHFGHLLQTSWSPVFSQSSSHIPRDEEEPKTEFSSGRQQLSE